jgi:hypothetical protein
MRRPETIHMRGDFLIAATPLDPPQDGKYWVFHLINNSSGPIESALLKEVGYEWGDMGNSTNPDAQFGPIAPGACLEIWRDNDSAAELRIWLTLSIRWAARARTLTVEFPKLYLVKRLSLIPVLGKPGILGVGALT